MEFRANTLIKREKEISNYLSEGMSLKNISVKTGLQKKTIEAHISKMMQKLMAEDLHDLRIKLKT